MTQQVNRVDMTTDEIGASKVRVCFWSNPDAALANPDEPGLCEVYAGLFEFESGVFEGYCEPSKANPLDLKQLKMKVSPDTLDTVFDEMGKVQKSDKIGLLVKRSRVFKVSDSPSSELPSWEDLAILAPPTTSSASAKKMMRSTLLTAATAIVVGFIVL